MKGQKIIIPGIVSVVFFSLIFVLNYSSIYADESIIDVQLTVPQTTPFGENAEIVITSHSDPVNDREIVNAEHKISRLEAKADSLQQKADDAQTDADNEPPGKKQDRLQVRADRIQGQADKAAANLCTQALEQQQKLAANGKSSDDIDDVVDACAA